MDFGLYLIYLLLATTLVWGARIEKRGEWNGAYASLEQMKPLEGAAALFITFHHMAQKTCGAWHEARFIVHGLDPFLPIGYAMCAIFLFASGRGLYVSLRTRPDISVTSSAGASYRQPLPTIFRKPSTSPSVC